MKVRIRATRVDDVKRRGRVCPCCSRPNWKCKLIDKQLFKEALEDTMVRQPNGWRWDLS